MKRFNWNMFQYEMHCHRVIWFRRHWNCARCDFSISCKTNKTIFMQRKLHSKMFCTVSFERDLYKSCESKFFLLKWNQTFSFLSQCFHLFSLSPESGGDIYHTFLIRKPILFRLWSPNDWLFSTYSAIFLFSWNWWGKESCVCTHVCEHYDVDSFIWIS